MREHHTKEYKSFDRLVLINLLLHGLLLLSCLTVLTYLKCLRHSKQWQIQRTSQPSQSKYATSEAELYMEQVKQIWHFAIYAILGSLLSACVYCFAIAGWWIFSILVIFSSLRYYILLHVMFKFALNELIFSMGHV